MEPKENRSIQRTQALLKDGLMALMQQKPIQKISVRELTDSVNLNRGTFYLHYKDIYDLMEQIETDMLQEFQEINHTHKFSEMNGTPYPLLVDLFRFLKKNAEFGRILLIENRDQTFVDKLKNILRERCLTDWAQMFENTNPELYSFYSSYVLSGCIGIIETWLRDGTVQSPKVMAEYTAHVILHGLDTLKRT